MAIQNTKRMLVMTSNNKHSNENKRYNEINESETLTLLIYMNQIKSEFLHCVDLIETRNNN